MAQRVAATASDSDKCLNMMVSGVKYFYDFVYGTASDPKHRHQEDLNRLRSHHTCTTLATPTPNRALRWHNSVFCTSF